MILAANQPDSVLQAHGAPVQSLAFSSDGRWVAAGDTVRIVTVHCDQTQMLEMDLSSTLERHRPLDRIRALKFAADSRTLFAAAGPWLHAIDLPTGQIRWSFNAKPYLCFMITSPQSIAITCDGALVAAFDSGYIGLFDDSGRQTGTVKDSAAPRQCALLKDGSTLVGTDSFTVSAYELKTKRRMWRIRPSEKSYGFALSPAQDQFALRHMRNASLYDFAGKVLLELPVRPGLPLVAFDPSGSRLALGSRHGADLFTVDGLKLGDIQLAGSRVTSLHFSSDRRLALGCSDGAIRFYDVDRRPAHLLISER